MSHALRRVSLETLLLAGALGLAASCSGSSEEPAAGAAAPEADTSAGVVSGSQAPDFTLETTEGRTFNLADTQGQVRLIDFWATWCKPCVEEVPMFKELQQTYGERGFTILAISDESSGVVREFVETNGVNYTNLIDPGEVSEGYGVLSLPAAYLVDRQGTVVETFQGPKPRRVLESKIVELLGETAGS